MDSPTAAPGPMPTPMFGSARSLLPRISLSLLLLLLCLLTAQIPQQEGAVSSSSSSSAGYAHCKQCAAGCTPSQRALRVKVPQRRCRVPPIQEPKLSPHKTLPLIPCIHIRLPISVSSLLNSRAKLVLLPRSSAILLENHQKSTLSLCRPDRKTSSSSMDFA